MASGSATLYPSGYNKSKYSYASVQSGYGLDTPVGKGSTNTTYSQWNLKTGSNAESYVFYEFDCSSIPTDATIKSISCSAKVYISQTNSSRISSRQVQLYYNTTTAKGSASTVSTSTTALNLSCGTWTRSELNAISLRIYSKRGTSNTTTTYYNRFYGATLTITYEYQAVTYTVTTSLNGNGTIEPSGSTSVEQGNDFTLHIIPQNESATITVKDNNVDVTNKLVNDGGDNIFQVNTKSGASYGFQQNYDGNCKPDWWQSTNKAKATSASVATVSFNVKQTTNVTIRCICYAEATYDYFLVGPLDGSLTTNASADSNAVFTTKNTNSQNEQTYTFNNVAAGNHTFDVKYYKDSYTDSNWDSAQFTVEFDPSNGESSAKAYILTNVSAAHTIVVTITESAQGTNCFIKVNGKQVEVSDIYKKVSGKWTQITVNDLSVNDKYYKV